MLEECAMIMEKVNSWFISDDIKSNLNEYRRANQLLIFVWLSALFFLPNSYKWYQMGVTNLAVSMFVVMIIVAFSPLLFKVTQSLALTGNFVFVALAWHFLYLPYLTGGIQSSALTWNLVLPLFAAAFIGIRSCVAWSVFMIVEIIVFYIMNKKGVELPVLNLSANDILKADFANILGPLIVFGIALFFIERGRNEM